MKHQRCWIWRICQPSVPWSVHRWCCRTDRPSSSSQWCNQGRAPYLQVHAADLKKEQTKKWHCNYDDSEWRTWIWLCVTWDRWDLFSSDPQKIPNVQLPNVEVHSISLQLFDQLLLPVVAATTQTNKGNHLSIRTSETRLTGSSLTQSSQWSQHIV